MKYGWKASQQANMLFCFQLADIASPHVLPWLLKRVGLKGCTIWSHRLSALCNLNTAVTPLPATNYANPVLLPLQPGYVLLDKVTAMESDLAGCGSGELAAASNNLIFIARLVMPWVRQPPNVRPRPERCLRA